MSLDSEIERTLLRSYPFSSKPPTARALNGFTDTPFTPPSLIVVQSVTGANKIAEYAVENGGADVIFEGPDNQGWAQYIYEISCQIGPWKTTGGAATAGMVAGIEIGTYDSATMASPPANPVAQLYWDFVAATFKIRSAPGDGLTAPTVVTAPGGHTALNLGSSRLRLIYDPFARKIIGYVNGVRTEMATLAAMPQLNSAGSLMASGLFVFSGSDAAAAGLQVRFNACYCKTVGLTRPPATLWY